MPNKTIYVKDADLPLFEHAQSLLGDSVSSLFADFLKERVGRVTPDQRMTDLVQQIRRKRETLKAERGAPQFLDVVYEESEDYARKALKSLRAGEIKKAKALYYAATVYHELAEHNRREIKAVTDKIADVLKK